MMLTITHIEKNIKIGIFYIRILNIDNNQNEYFLPYNAELFMDDKVTNNNYTLHYIIQFEDFKYDESTGVLLKNYDIGPMPYRIYKLNNGDYLWCRKNTFQQLQLVYKISSNWSSFRLLADYTDGLGKDSFSELFYIFAYSILKKSSIVFHGVVMKWKGKGIIFCAHSGVGKTTHSRMWRDNHNAIILNGDRALCCKEHNHWYTYGAPWCGSSEEFRNDKTKLNAVVILEQAEINEVSRLAPFQGALELIPLAFAPDWEENLMNCALDIIDNIVQNIPIYKLRCRHDLDAVAVLKEELEKQIG